MSGVLLSFNLVMLPLNISEVYHKGYKKKTFENMNVSNFDIIYCFLGEIHF